MGLSPRDSGFDGAASSLKFDSRPSSSTAKVETDEVRDYFLLISFQVEAKHPPVFPPSGIYDAEMTCQSCPEQFSVCFPAIFPYYKVVVRRCYNTLHSLPNVKYSCCAKSNYHDCPLKVSSFRLFRDVRYIFARKTFYCSDGDM